ncbi:AAA family ATPase [Methanococcoides orientis]|uniref:AAA family ATPase n=1 Tax=Methanococcoides orientis TaxID=2822137 RepID=UPI001E44318D|nr:AAA family ATPase [Methanococcoides orientis]UGV41771.1 AAA family ATPase [Methanococcoides orientis]
MNIDTKITNLIKSGAPIIQIISYETLRIHASLIKAASKTGRTVYVWNRTEGLSELDQNGQLNEKDEDMRDPSSILEWFVDNDSDNLLLLLEDFHPDLTEQQPHIINRLRCIARSCLSQKLINRTLLLSQPIKHLPVELEKDVQVVELPLPSTNEIKQIMKSVRQRFDLHERDYQESSRLTEAALGLTTTEASLAFSMAAVGNKRLTDAEVPLIAAEKEQVIRKRGHLEFYQPDQGLDEIGGLDKLKDWLGRRERAFTEDARDFGLESPRGILLLGLPGTGKSLAAKAVSNAWQLPLLRLDMGRVFGGIVGQSEENIRSALNTAEALAPCILWIDEIEKGMAGAQSSGATDGGTTSRVLGTFLTWMQEKTKPVFVLATANNISQLPPELLRKGRVDEIFFVDLPDSNDRKDIIRIHLRKRKRSPTHFTDIELDHLVEISRGFTGAELEEAVKEAMFRSFDYGRDITADDLEDAINDTTPLSHTMREVIESTRQWAKGRAVPASDRAPEVLDKIDIRSKQPRLRQEIENPFISDIEGQ